MMSWMREQDLNKKSVLNFQGQQDVLFHRTNEKERYATDICYYGVPRWRMPLLGHILNGLCSSSSGTATVLRKNHGITFDWNTSRGYVDDSAGWKQQDSCKHLGDSNTLGIGASCLSSSKHLPPQYWYSSEDLQHCILRKRLRNLNNSSPMSLRILCYTTLYLLKRKGLLVGQPKCDSKINVPSLMFSEPMSPRPSSNFLFKLKERQYSTLSM